MYIMAVTQLTTLDFKDRIFNYEKEEEWKYAGTLPAIIDFYADWCGPCKMISPIVDELAETYDGRMKVAKVNIDQNRATAIKYHVRSIPMLLLFKDGQIQATQVGAVGKGQLTQMIDKTL